MNTSNPLFKIVAGVVGVVIGYAVVVVGFLNKEASLEELAAGMNKNLPMAVDSETRWDTSVAGPGNKFTYIYTIVNQTKDEVDVPKIQGAIRSQIISSYRTSDQMKPFRDRNVELHYEYRDKNGEFVFEIVVTHADLQPDRE